MDAGAFQLTAFFFYAKTVNYRFMLPTIIETSLAILWL
jgi:hypothetical protein